MKKRIIRALLTGALTAALCGSLVSCGPADAPGATPTPEAASAPAVSVLPTWEATPLPSPTPEAPEQGETQPPSPTPEATPDTAAPSAPADSAVTAPAQPSAVPTPATGEDPSPLPDTLSDAVFQAAEMTPETVLFQGGITAEAYLARVTERIAALERRDEELGVEFNWFHTLEDGTTYLNSVKTGALNDLGVSSGDGTKAYTNFDVQVFYSRYIDLTGETL